MDIKTIGAKAKAASYALMNMGEKQKNDILLAMADALEAKAEYILEANRKDIEIARKKGTRETMIDRLASAAAEGKEKGIKGLPMQMGIEMAAEMIAEIKAQNLCDGVHIMAIGAEKNVPVILEKAGIDISK